MSDEPEQPLGGDQPFDLERVPLERTSSSEHDWGGDGSDLSRPVRAHVLAALRPSGGPYQPPVSRLLTQGDPRVPGVDKRIRGLGLRQQHLPELLRMARDRALYTAPGESDEVWAPLHALAALAELDLGEQVAEIVPLFDVEDDWYDTALPELMGRVGAPALAPLREYLADPTRWGFGHTSAADALEKIAEQHPDLRDQAVAILSDVLRDAEHYHEDTVTGALSALIGLRAVEALPLIRRAFELGKVDESVPGPWGDVLDELDVKPEPGDPLIAESRQRFEERHERMFPREQREQMLAALDQLKARAPTPPPPAPLVERDPQRAAQARARKQKNKRKAESAARKANRRKRK
jgi:hypothetical protein